MVLSITLGGSRRIHTKKYNYENLTVAGEKKFTETFSKSARGLPAPCLIAILPN